MASKGLIGKKFRELIGESSFMDSNKGRLGWIIQENYFGRPQDNKPFPDFAEVSTELKVSPVKVVKYKGKQRYSAKERLSLSMIDYSLKSDDNFMNSSFLKKNSHILLVIYEWAEHWDYLDYPIIWSDIFSIPERDIPVIKKDWEIIVDKIRAGQAATLSETDTLYLAASRKGSGKGKDLRDTPFGEKNVPSRSFSLKGSYMTAYHRKNLDPSSLESTFSPEEIVEKGLDAAIAKRLTSFESLSAANICEKFDITPSGKAKNFLAILSSRMLGAKLVNHPEAIEELGKSGIIVKTIKVNSNGTIKESMSFPYFDPNKLILEKWDGDQNETITSSEVRKFFQENRILFIIFKEMGDGLYYSHHKIWAMPTAVLDGPVRKTWENTQYVIGKGVEVSIDKAGRRRNNLPGISFNQIFHVRPHARNKEDEITFPHHILLTKQAFWLDHKYIKAIINNEESQYLEMKRSKVPQK